MATTGTSKAVWAALAALLALLAVAGASTLTLFDGNFLDAGGCTGNALVISCGKCKNINSTMQGGYYFLYTGGNALLYNSDDCGGSNPGAVLTDDEWSCQRFAYKSAYVSCSSSGPWDITAPQ